MRPGGSTVTEKFQMPHCAPHCVIFSFLPYIRTNIGFFLFEHGHWLLLYLTLAASVQAALQILSSDTLQSTDCLVANGGCCFDYPGSLGALSLTRCSLLSSSRAIHLG